METEERFISIETFGAELLRTEDLDPLYVALTGAFKPEDRDQLRRWLFAYWCCYHAGASSYISEFEGADYWGAMRLMAANLVSAPVGGRWPRGHERRHFRGQKAIDAVESYFKKCASWPEDLVRWIEEAAPLFSDVRRRVMELPQFGPWIAFKVGDMMERVLGVRMDFTKADVLMFDQPYNSALEVYRSRFNGTFPNLPDRIAVETTAQFLVDRFKMFSAPPRRDRPVNIQEVETILCKWKSHNNGSYPMGLDTKELRHGLEQWASVSKTAAALLMSTPTGAYVVN